MEKRTISAIFNSRKISVGMELFIQFVIGCAISSSAILIIFKEIVIGMIVNGIIVNGTLTNYRISENICLLM